MRNVISLSSIIRNLSYWSKQAGVRWQLLLSIAGLWLVTVWLRNEYGQDDSNLWLVMNQFMRLMQWTLVGLVTLSLLSALSTWAYFRYQIIKKGIAVMVNFGDGHKAEAGWVPLTVTINGLVLRPMLGNIHARLIFSEKRVSRRIILDSDLRKSQHLWRQGIRGTGATLLHDRGIYDVERVLISFCDMLALVSLPFTVPVTQQLYTLPRLQMATKVQATPNTAEEQKHRIEMPRRVEGEHVNYKEFETGDNIRRIVWKIYAKSGQLVVRVPETKDPYASHLYFYASYFHGFHLKIGAFETELLNIYKDHIRNMFEALKRNGYEVRLPQDQEIPKLAGLSEKHNELFQITASSWQNKLTPASFVGAGKAAFVCLSSLVPASEVELVLQHLPINVPLVVVKLSEAIPSPFRIQLKDIFFKPEKQPADSLRQPWLISSSRRALLKNEREIAASLKRRGNSWLTNTVEFERWA